MTNTAAPPSSHGLPWSHMLLALVIVAIWGTNFVVIRVGLDGFPPLLFATLRFTLVLWPAAMFIRWPAVPWRSLATYGVLIGFGQFGLTYIAISGYIAPGLASLVVQAQIFFTIGLSIWLKGERVKPYQIFALVMAMIGIGVIILHVDHMTTPLGLALILIAAMCWAGGNHVARTSGTTEMLGFVIWASLFSIPPLFAASLAMEGWPAISRAIAHAGPGAWAALIWQSVGNTLFGYTAWGWLLSRHPAATITPTAMLIPIFGMGASALLLGEPLPGWKLSAAALVMSGLALNMLWPLMGRWRAYQAGLICSK